jgi:hypothetical protein
VGADQAVQLMLDHKRCDRRNLDHLVAQWLGIVTGQSFTTRLAVAGVMVDHLLALLRGEQLAAGAGMALLSAPLTARAFACLLTTF